MDTNKEDKRMSGGSMCCPKCYSSNTNVVERGNPGKAHCNQCGHNGTYSDFIAAGNEEISKTEFLHSQVKGMSEYLSNRKEMRGFVIMKERDDRLSIDEGENEEECEQCHTSYLVKHSDATEANRFCSIDCEDEHEKEFGQKAMKKEVDELKKIRDKNKK